MGEAGRDALRVGFEGTIKLEFHGAKVSSDAGLFPYRDIDEAAQLTESGAAELIDFRSGSNIQRSTIALLRQSVYSRLAGYEDTNDAERLSVDPVLRHGNVASADDWRAVLLPVIERYREVDVPKYLRGDAAFAIPRLYDLLESEGYDYAIRLKANSVLQRRIDHLLKRLVGRPPKKPRRIYHSFEYQAQSWDIPRHVVVKVEWHQGELIPRVGFIVTNLNGWAKRVVDFYNGRGTAEQWIKEGKHEVHWTRLSCHDFDDNQVRLQLFVLAYNLGNFSRRFALPASVKHWTLTTLRDKLIKIGAKFVRHARYVTLQLAEVAVPRQLYRAILERIQRFAGTPPRAVPARRG